MLNITVCNIAIIANKHFNCSTNALTSLTGVLRTLPLIKYQVSVTINRILKLSVLLELSIMQHNLVVVRL